MGYTLITGASSGIGRELASLFAADGHDLVITARNRTALAEVKSLLERRYGVHVETFAIDLSENDFKFKGKDYHSLVSRTPDENLPHVTNELGDTYVDNKIVLHLTRGNETVLNKTFTKNDFSSVVDANFLSKSILEGIVYDKTTPQGIVYAASVCYPQTDLYMPLSITITADGKMSIQKVDILEEDYDDEAPN